MSVEDTGAGGGLRQARRVGAYVAEELGNDAGLIALELTAGLAGIVGLGMVEGTLALQQSNGGTSPAASQSLRYALLTMWPSLAGRPFPSDLGVRSVLNQPLAPRAPALKAGAIPLRLRNVQAGRQLVAFATVVGVTMQVGTSIQRGRARYQQQVHEGREPPLAPPPAVRISHRAPVPDGTAPAFHVALAAGADDRVPWWTSSGASSVPRRWWSRAGWIQDPREWAAMLPSTLCASAYSKDIPLFLEVEVATAERPRGLSLDLALECLRAGGQASGGRSGAAGDGAVRILLAGGEVMRPLTRRMVEESGAVDLLVDGEAAVAMAVLSWMEKTPYASAWAALAAQRTREEEAKISARREGNPLWKGYEQMNAWVDRVPVSTVVELPWQWLARSWEVLGRRLRWLVKGGVTARDALEEYKVLVLVHDADAARLGQRLKLKELLQGAGWDVWGPGRSASRLVQDKDALVPVLVYCQDDATTLERARFLIRAGRPPQLTCALLEDPESACPWLGQPNAKDEARPTVLSVADIHDSLFAFVRARIKAGRTLQEVQHELDSST